MRTLRRVRKANNLTLKNLSVMSGLTVCHLSRMERGKFLPTITTRKRLELLLGERIDFITINLVVTIKDLPIEEQLYFIDKISQQLNKLKNRRIKQ